MMYAKVLAACAFSVGITLASPCAAGYEATVSTPSGDYLLQFQSEDSFLSLMEAVHQCSANDGEEKAAVQIELSVDEGTMVIKTLQAKMAPRDYYAPVTPSEKKELSYILKTLSESSLAKIGKEKSKLKKAGKKIDHLHPFKFIETIFTDDKLKVCIRNLEGKSWVWGEFRDGLTSSLAKEAAVNNLKDEYIVNMANIVQIDVNAIMPTIQGQNWSKLVTDLIALVPRSENADRYNQ